MPNDDTPRVIMVPVKRYDVTVTMDDILIPLTQTATHLTAAGMISTAPSADAAQHLEQFNELVAQLKQVVDRINQIDPSLLASKPGPPPG